ncbi:1-acylglycerol-3-phosphate O-acyltransferase [Wielerella bovis]|uniref:lysophospholipid acyltransferase family protein n=1 Tax=Wielerella bovis TaxID=2917790 RepID=UPI0020192717|nr:1-acylglycerol-3-phosphate O-acyltransferase [Wielerella bovis]ULJ68836.1 1-acylglycerol-3-phosphate O-acyltransferase [Wielerella bovis]
MAIKTSFCTRVMRIIKLLAWLYATGKRLGRLDGATLEQRHQTLRDLSVACLKILNVHLDTRYHAEKQPKTGLLIAANHVSWLDIFVLSALYPASFIAMQEIKKWPVIGKIVGNAGTVFIDRSSRKDIDVINAAISQELERDGNVCFFPEARTTLGNGVLPLKAALFQAALNSNQAVQPIVLRYYDNQTRTQAVSFAGINLLRSLWQIVSIERIDVKVDVCAQILPSSLAEQDRFLMKDEVERCLSEIVLLDSPKPNKILPE